MDCWLEDPSKRPAFAELQAKFEAFPNDNQHLIQFPKSEDIRTSSNTAEPFDNVFRDAVSLGGLSPTMDYLTIQNRREQNKNLLVVGTGMRRILSEPILEGWQAVPMSDDESEVDIKRRSLSNSYVSTPKRDSWFQIKLNNNTVCNQEIPQVHIIPAIDDDM